MTGMTLKQIAGLANVGETTVRRWVLQTSAKMAVSRSVFANVPEAVKEAIQHTFPNEQGEPYPNGKVLPQNAEVFREDRMKCFGYVLDVWRHSFATLRHSLREPAESLSAVGCTAAWRAGRRYVCVSAPRDLEALTPGRVKPNRVRLPMQTKRLTPEAVESWFRQGRRRAKKCETTRPESLLL